MALINNLYVFVENESVSLEAETTSHPVEKGFELSDHVTRKPVTLSISGKIVNYEKMNAQTVLSRIKELQKKGSLITYIGRNSSADMQIQSFSTSHPYTNWGGVDFDMTLKHVRIAKPAYIAKQKSTTQKDTTQNGTQQVEKGENQNVYHVVKKGDCIWNLVTKQYKSLEPKYSNVMDKCNWVMQQNPTAFSRKGDFRTLQIGKKILIGYRK